MAAGHREWVAVSTPTIPVVGSPVVTGPVVGSPVPWAELGDEAAALSVAPRARRRAGRAAALTLVLCDTVAALGSLAVAGWLLPLPAGAGGPAGRVAVVLLSWLAIVGVLAARGTYSGARRRLAPRVADDLVPLAASLVVAGLCLLSVDALVPAADRVPPSYVGVVLGTCLVAAVACRSLGLLVASAWSANVQRVVVVGSDEVAGALVRRLSRSRLVDVVGVVDDEPAGGQHTLGAVEDLPRICEARRVDRVVIAFSQRHPARSAQVLRTLHDGVDIDVVARYYELMSWESRISDVTGLSLVSVGRPPGLGAAAAKRALDLVVAAVGLALLSPVLAVVALGVLVESGRPVLFRQTRVGRGGRPFAIVKFRTMRPAPPSPTPRSPLDLAPDPARVTRLGGLLRRTGVDELPQLLNVVRGEMSLVGPRPFVPEECTDLHGWSRRRFDVRPGMTGMWQVCGQHELTFDELCRLDVQYATTWTLRSDLRILSRTPGRLLRGSAPGR